jgi:proteasome lid subunit RPN8/RPN11
MERDRFFLAEAIHQEIITHAREGKPKEVCGILRGRGSRASALVRGHNVAPNPVLDYEVDPATLLLQFEFEEEGDEMVGIYHSHPVSPAYPSASDAWNAYYPDCAYLICSLEDDTKPSVRCFRMLPQPVSLDVARLQISISLDETRPGRFGYYQPDTAPLPPELGSACGGIPRPFYIVFERSPQTGLNADPRVISVIEEQIQIEPDRVPD